MDPDRHLADLYVATAQRYGFDADAATGPVDAFARMASVPYGIVAADLEERGVGHRSLMEELCDRYPGLTFVAITHRAGLEQPRTHKLDTALATIVLKPLEFDMLSKVLHDAFELHHRRSQGPPNLVDHSTVLLVEDSDGDALLVSEYLSEVCGAAVTRTSRIDDAAQALRSHTYDFVICDLSLPDARGLDAVRALQPLAPQVPLIVLTGVDDEDLALHAMQHGAQDYLVKGQLDVPTLRRTLRHAAERKRVSNRLVHLSRHDSLTDVGNRTALRDRIETALARACRHDIAFAVMFIDLDQFKAINDALGHDAGDAVLIEVAARISQCVRSSDLVARLGGDEFAVLLDDLQPGDQPLEVARRIIDSLGRPIALRGGEITVAASVGTARYPEVSGTADDMLRAADTAMYLAKRQGRNNIVGATNAEEQARVARVHDVQYALERGELALDFQPQFTADPTHVVACEALLRWHRPGGVTVGPADFIPLLEASGQIVAVGAWVLDRACAQLASWRAAGWRELRVAVNLSARQLEDDRFVDCITACLRRHDVPARLLELELTESVLMRDTVRAKRMLGQLRALGVRIAIDDFGTGYSSLAYLSRFEVDCLKIDRSFIDQVHVDRERALIATAIVTLGHHLGLDVVAEGVELAEHLAFAQRAKCDLVQGYLLGRPAAAEQVEFARYS